MQRKSDIGIVWQFLCIFLISFIFLIINSNTEFYYDSGYYGYLSGTFIQNGRFSLSNFPPSIRGVCFPLILFLFNKFFEIGNIGRGWIFLSSSLLGLIVCILPSFFKTELNNNNTLFKKRLFLLCTILIFWKGLFIYPLSDAVAFTFLITGIGLLVKASQCNSNLYILESIVGGCSLYFSYNTRTIYLFSVILFIMLYSFVADRNTKKQYISITIWAILGIMIGSIPQILVNVSQYHMHSPLVQTNTSDFPNGLFAWQLGMGILNSQYETYIGIKDLYPQAGLNFIDPVGTYLLDIEGLSVTAIRISDIIKLIFKYPLEIIGIYTRHFINILNPVRGEVYISNLFKTKFLLTIINYIFMFFCSSYYFLNVKYKNMRKSLAKKPIRLRLLVYSTILIPCIMILPGCVELRFFFPAYVIFYGFLFFEINFEDIVMVLKTWREAPILSFFLFFMNFFILCAVWGNTYSNLQYSNMLIQ